MSAYDLSVPLQNRPGALADVAEALAQAGVNVEGVAGWGQGDAGQVHFLVTDAETATRALEAAGYAVERQREALFASVDNRPGILELYTNKLAENGVNLEAVYLAAGTRLVVVTDNVLKAGEIWRLVNVPTD